jgi:hypothetical protein
MPPVRSLRLPPAEVLLVLANLLPVAGVLLFAWDLGSVLLLYWAESGVIAAFNALKMIRVGGGRAAFLVPFFLVHYGIFMLVHGAFLLLFLSWGPGGGGADLDPRRVAAGLGEGWGFALLALGASHGASFVLNFLGRREWEGRTIERQMLEPYGRILVMHLVLLLGAVPAVLLGAPWPLLVLLVAFKIVADLRAHRAEHAAAPPEATPRAAWQDGAS